MSTNPILECLYCCKKIPNGFLHITCGVVVSMSAWRSWRLRFDSLQCCDDIFMRSLECQLWVLNVVKKEKKDIKIIWRPTVYVCTSGTVGKKEIMDYQGAHCTVIELAEDSTPTPRLSRGGAAAPRTRLGENTFHDETEMFLRESESADLNFTLVNWLLPTERLSHLLPSTSPYCTLCPSLSSVPGSPSYTASSSARPTAGRREYRHDIYVQVAVTSVSHPATNLVKQEK